jgi:hypothetical protein
MSCCLIGDRNPGWDAVFTLNATSVPRVLQTTNRGRPTQPLPEPGVNSFELYHIAMRAVFIAAVVALAVFATASKVGFCLYA